MITLYSTHCPKCKVVEMKVKQLNLECNIIDDTDEVVAVGKAHGIQSAPILQVDDNYYDFNSAIKYLKENF